MAGQGVARRRLLVTFAASFGAALVLGFVAAIVAELGKLKPELTVYAFIAIALSVVAVMALMLWLTARWWRAADEAAREAHKWSWYWGGSTGLALGGVPFILLYTMPETVEAMLPADLTTAQAVVLGMGLLGGLQLAGYGLFWAGWWLARR
ncbi:hypothetical protein V7S57_20015 [Caulobacter sp. CCNWLY153]|uniref:hypothetical protein n=1 Tax=unclassified Caulobacter TaxID=2648921 RepID=UPI002FF3A19C